MCDKMLKKHQELAKKMNLVEILEFTRGMTLRDGGLSILLEKIVEEIEKLKKRSKDFGIP